jgi:hypothetical protein
MVVGNRYQKYANFVCHVAAVQNFEVKFAKFNVEKIVKKGIPIYNTVAIILTCTFVSNSKKCDLSGVLSYGRLRTNLAR